MVTLVFWILAQAPYVLDREEYELRPTSQSRVSSSVCGDRSAQRLDEWVAPVLPRLSVALAKTPGILRAGRASPQRKAPGRRTTLSAENFGGDINRRDKFR